jgi:hypothetical protein
MIDRVWLSKAFGYPMNNRDIRRSASCTREMKSKFLCDYLFIYSVVFGLMLPHSAYELYKDSVFALTRTGPKAVPQDHEQSLCEHFKDTFSQEGVTVHFVGAW